jgi:aspartyl-tRNA(Asn)/glutamyl-tRNA(Gln) amidotransferase subunit A
LIEASCALWPGFFTLHLVAMNAESPARTELHRLSVATIREAAPVAVIEACLDRIARFDGAIGGFSALDLEGARAAAAESAVHKHHGMVRPLEGVPMGVTSMIDVEALAVTDSGADMIATDDAAIVRLLREAGAVILGHLDATELAPRAPDDQGCVAWGAAVASGMCCVALGIDTIGETRAAAAHDGIYGLKPGHGLIDTEAALSLPRYSGLGLLARSVADLVAVMAILAPPGPVEPVRRVAVLRGVGGPPDAVLVHAAVDAAAAALAAMGLETGEVALPDLDDATIGQIVIRISDGASQATSGPDDGRSGISGMLTRLLGDTIGGPLETEVAIAQAATALHRLLDDADVLLMPTLARLDPARVAEAAAYTVLANLAGLPALSMPAYRGEGDTVVSVQILGRLGSEATLLALAAQLDTALAAYRWPQAYP